MEARLALIRKTTLLAARRVANNKLLDRAADSIGIFVKTAIMPSYIIGGYRTMGKEGIWANVPYAKERQSNNIRAFSLLSAQEGSRFNEEFKFPGTYYLNLRGADLSFKNLKGVNLAGADLRDSTFVGTDLTEANFTETRLAGAMFKDALLIRTTFVSSDLRGANIREADLTGAKLLRADLSLTNLEGANLAWADLLEANLVKVCLSKAKLLGAVLSSTNMEEADLAGADLRGASFNGATMVKANFTGAQFNDMTDFARANLLFAKGLPEAIIKKFNLLVSPEILEGLTL